MNRLPGFFAISSLFLLISCGSGPAKDDTKATDTTAAVVPAPAEVKPVFSPFNVIIIQHKVKNFDNWKTAYLAHDSVRKAYGISEYLMGRDLKDSSLVFVMDKMEDLEKAKTFSSLPALKVAMNKAGVIGKPGFSYAVIIRNDESPVEAGERLSIAHHVKDFASWLKAFDAEGSATRATYGLVDRQLGRSLVDSNMVYILFAVTDLAKAKARVMSPELKKTMTDAGVDSPPTTRWFRLVK